MEFYNIDEQTKYKTTVTKPKSIDQLSDLFITDDELKHLTGAHWFSLFPGTSRSLLHTAVITRELKKLSNELEASGAKTIKIEDEDLVDVLKDSYVSNYIDHKYGRHGDRLCYAKRYKRKQTKPTRTNVRQLWWAFDGAFRAKFGCCPPHIPIYLRGPTLFKAFKKILGWKRVSESLGASPTPKKFYRQIWDNPEEYM